MRYLTKEYVVFINRKTIRDHGGQYVAPYNFLHESALDYLIDAPQAEMFGQEMYPSISDKAGLYLFSIVANHIFQDGNKRTGLEAALLFLSLNGFGFKDDLSNDDIERFVIRTASGELSLQETQEWFKANIIQY